jgi:hypothetical protein
MKEGGKHYEAYKELVEYGSDNRVKVNFKDKLQ